MTETTERFLQEIATRVGYDRVAELYLFPVLRQGGVEGAVAVVAAHPEPVAHDAGADDAGVAEQADSDVADDDADARRDEVGEVPSREGSAESVSDDRAGYAPIEDTSSDDVVAAETVDAADIAAPRPERARHVVYTARYRHTIKGTDRGRWMVEVVAEADAPLITVEEVVRGVVRRSGDAFQPERISGDQFRAIVPAPADRGSAPA